MTSWEVDVRIPDLEVEVNVTRCWGKLIIMCRRRHIIAQHPKIILSHASVNAENCCDGGGAYQSQLALKLDEMTRIWGLSVNDLRGLKWNSYKYLNITYWSLEVCNTSERDGRVGTHRAPNITWEQKVHFATTQRSAPNSLASAIPYLFCLKQSMTTTISRGGDGFGEPT